MTAPGSDPPLATDPRAEAAAQARQVVMAVAKAHTLFSGAANSLDPGHRALADEAFTLLEAAVHDLRDLVARLESERFALEPRAPKQQRRPDLA